MHFGDYTFIFLLALVLFGPKKLPEIGRQLGKLLAEFRRASNEFKFQIQEELRNMEEEERRKKTVELEAARTVAVASDSTPAENALPASTGPTIQPPSTGAAVSTSKPFASPAIVEGVEEEAGVREAEIQDDPSVPDKTNATLTLVPSELHEALEGPGPVDRSETAPRQSENGAHPIAQEAAAQHD